MTRTSWNCATKRRQAGTGLSAASSLRPKRPSRVRASSSVNPCRSSDANVATTSPTGRRYARLGSGGSLNAVSNWSAPWVGSPQARCYRTPDCSLTSATSNRRLETRCPTRTTLPSSARSGQRMVAVCPESNMESFESIPPPMFRLPHVTHIGAAHLHVVELQRSLSCCTQVLGLRAHRTPDTSTVLSGRGPESARRRRRYREDCQWNGCRGPVGDASSHWVDGI